METTSQFELASKIIQDTGCSLFLTGKAGTGKTTFLRELKQKCRKRNVVTAPTGIAAINAGGMTLHSFFQLDFGVFVPGMKRESKGRMSFSKQKIRIIRGLDLLIIDEISMVRADLLDAVDDVLRRYRDRTRPFGGVQLLLIGDLQQLPPVVVESERELLMSNYRSPYFFDSHALQQLEYVTIELDKVFRQNDADFLALLNAVRDNRADSRVLSQLNSRCIPGFNPPDSEGYVRLTTHNHLANQVNDSRLRALSGESHVFKANIVGNFPQSSYPADPELELKEGARVMFIKNDNEHRYFNGMMGKVSSIDDKGVVVIPDDGTAPISVEPVIWENAKYSVNEETKEIVTEVDGTFTQIPLKLAWSITIHKSQGLTFDRAIIDASASFSHGQTYVALSRCRTLEGLVLESPLSPRSIINDRTVTGFLEQHVMQNLDDNTVENMMHAYWLNLASEMFNLRPLFNALEGVTRIYSENFMRIYPAQVQELISESDNMRSALTGIGDKFGAQLRQLDASGEKGRVIQRIKDASSYFLKNLDALMKMVAEMPTEHDNKTVLTKLRERLDLFENIAFMRKELFEAFSDEDFNADRYYDLKAKGAFRQVEKARRERKEKPSELTADNLHPELFDLLRSWRYKKAVDAGTPAFTICSTRALLGISNYMPATFQELGMMPGMGDVMVKRHGDEIIDIVDCYREAHPEQTAPPIPFKKNKSRHTKKR